MFAGLMSRCTMPSPCACRSADATPRAMTTASAGVIGRAMRSASDFAAHELHHQVRNAEQARAGRDRLDALDATEVDDADTHDGCVSFEAACASRSKRR